MGLKLNLNLTNRLQLLAAAAVVALVLAPAPAAGQQGPGSAVSCTASLITSFTPCFNYLTNSSNGSPTRDCCQSLAALTNASAGCACLILTGGMPLGLGVPVNRTLAVSLPKACNSMAVPLQCRSDTPSTQIPAPGPAADAPSQLTPLPPATPATPEPEAPAPPAEPTATAPVSQGQTRQMVLPSSSGRARVHVPGAAAFVLLLAAAAALA